MRPLKFCLNKDSKSFWSAVIFFKSFETAPLPLLYFCVSLNQWGCLLKSPITIIIPHHIIKFLIHFLTETRFQPTTFARDMSLQLRVSVASPQEFSQVTMATVATPATLGTVVMDTGSSRCRLDTNEPACQGRRTGAAKFWQSLAFAGRSGSCRQIRDRLWLGFSSCATRFWDRASNFVNSSDVGCHQV